MDIKEICVVIISTFLISFIITPIIKKIAFHIKSVDKPNKRRINKVPMPTLGGLAIFLSFILGYMIFSNKITDMIAIIFGGIVILFTGIIDDINPIKPKYKLMGQIAGAIIVTFYGGLLIERVDAFGIFIDFGMFSHVVTIFFIVGMVNVLNFIDGLDGLAAGLSEIFFITIAVIALIQQKSNGLDIYLTLIMLGSTAGFLVHNFYPAKIYLGDSGAMFLGYIISVIAILGFKVVTITSVVVPIFILAIPIFDTFFVILRRLKDKKSVSIADKTHLHHRLLDFGFNHRNTVIIIYIMDIFFAFATIIYSLYSQKTGIFVYICLLIIILTAMIVRQRNSKKSTTK